MQVQEGNAVTLSCEVSKVSQVQWSRGPTLLTPGGEKHLMKQSGSTLELQIRKSQPEDSGSYSCVCGEARTTATVTITGELHTVTGNV